MNARSDSNHVNNIVIIGGGLMGAAAAYRLSLIVQAECANVHITLLERGEKDFSTGSSAGETRITRKTSFENSDVIPEMTMWSNSVLYQLGAIEPSQTVILGNNPRYINQAITAAVNSQVIHTPLAQAALSIPYIHTKGLDGIIEAQMDEDGNGSGIINPRVAIRQMLQKAEQSGVALKFQTIVDSIVENSDGRIDVHLKSGETIRADKVIAAASVWNDNLVGAPTPASLYTKAKVLKVFWFKFREETNLKEFPNFIFKIKGGMEFAAMHPGFANKYPGYDFTDPSTEEGFYMLKEVLSDGTYLKLGHYQPAPRLKEDADVIFGRESITKDHETLVAGFVREFLPGLAPQLLDVYDGSASMTKTYLESFANDAMPVIGPRLSRSNVVVMTGFSGIGAKFAVAAGFYAAFYALNRPNMIPERARLLFAPDRKTLRPKIPSTWQINGNLGAPGPDGTVQSPPCLDMGLLGEKAAKLYRNGYPANAGIPEAQIAAANIFNRFKADKPMFGPDIQHSHIFLATGGATDATQIAIDHAKSRFKLDGKPKALLITPTYHLYVGQLEQNGFCIEYVDSADKFNPEHNLITPQTDGEILARIEQSITPDFCLLFINSPRNPDGKICSREFLVGILKILNDNPYLRIISDTIYKQVAPRDQNVLTLFGLATLGQRRRIYEIDGTSKSVAKTMDRAAWVISDPTNIEEIAAVSHLKRGRPALPQMLQVVSMDEYLGINAPDYSEKNSKMYVGKLNYVAAAASQVVGLHCSPYLGAYYGYLDFRAVDFGLPMTSQEKENALIDALIVKGIAVSPGSIFKHPGAMRFNASFRNQTLRRLMDAIIDTFEEFGAKVTRRDVPLPAIDSPDYGFQPYSIGILSTQKPDVMTKLTAKLKNELGGDIEARSSNSIQSSPNQSKNL